MATFNLHTLELRAASLTGVRATGQGSTGLFVAGSGNPAASLSSPRHPLPGRPKQTGNEPAGAYRDLAMDTPGGRAGRSAGSAGVTRQVGFASIWGRATRLGWSACPGAVGKTPWVVDHRTTRYSCPLARMQASAVELAKTVCG